MLAVQRTTKGVFIIKRIFKFQPYNHELSFVGGMFIATSEEVQAAIGKTAVFINVVGNGNDITHVLNEMDFSIMDAPQEKIDNIIANLGDMKGFNPLDHLREDI